MKLIRFFNTLNFDTALGAVSFVFSIAYFLQIEMDLTIYTALFISVLSIYNIDHLIDALKLKDTPKSYRHTFYQKHFKLLMYWQAILAVVGFIVLFYLPVLVLWAGLGLLIIITLYFWVIFNFTHINLFFREVIVAIGYTFAVAFVPFLSGEVHIKIGFIWMLVIVFLIALTNLWIFSMYDSEIDHSQNHHSIARSIKQINLQIMVRGVITLTFIAVVTFALFYEQWLLGSALFFVEVTYLLLLEKQSVFRKKEYYRIIGESILMLPGITILLYNAV